MVADPKAVTASRPVCVAHHTIRQAGEDSVEGHGAGPYEEATICDSERIPARPHLLKWTLTYRPYNILTVTTSNNKLRDTIVSEYRQGIARWTNRITACTP